MSLGQNQKTNERFLLYLSIVDPDLLFFDMNCLKAFTTINIENL